MAGGPGQARRVPGGAREVADHGEGLARLQLAGKVAAGRPGEMAAGGAVSFPFACR